jgi:hypothetical protein
MSRKAVFAVVLHLSRLGSSLLHVRANITNETYLFLVITIVADRKLRQRRLWTTAAAIAAVASGCGWWLRTAAADNDDGSLSMKTMAAGSGGGGS